MKVRAIKKCYFDCIRNPGDVFEIPDGQTPNGKTLEIVGDEPQKTQSLDDLSDDELRGLLAAKGVKLHARTGREKLLAALSGGNG